MNVNEVNLFTWIIDGMEKAKYNFSSSGMPEFDLRSIGINLTYDEYARRKENLEKEFNEMIGEMYGVEADQVISTTGGTEGIALGSIFLHKNSECIDVPVPEYEPMYRVPESMGFKTERVNPYAPLHPEKNHSLSTTIPNNPTGELETERHLDEYLDGKHSTYLDETFREFMFPEKPFTLLHTYPEAVVSTTMTKFYGASSWRVGWMLADRGRIKELKNYRSLTTGSSARFSLYACMKILEKRRDIQNFVKEVIDQNRRTVRELLTRAGLKFTSPDRSSFTYVQTEGDSLQMAERMLENRGFLISPGKYFGIPTGYRLCITSKPDEFRSELEKFCEYYENRK
ncbi:MAG: pyridoxal phosphate-dependent aminotransferase [Candidatus Thermoplasmatota archaeon]|nr:pyridoxal phosphate-dependent aminotransferase [Candidatus Thermoplasmatota archaeon]